jgi:hypothetical protein
MANVWPPCLAKRCNCLYAVLSINQLAKKTGLAGGGFRRLNSSSSSGQNLIFSSLSQKFIVSSGALVRSSLSSDIPGSYISVACWLWSQPQPSLHAHVIRKTSTRMLSEKSKFWLICWLIGPLFRPIITYMQLLPRFLFMNSKQLTAALRLVTY